MEPMKTENIMFQETLGDQHGEKMDLLDSEEKKIHSVELILPQVTDINVKMMELLHKKFVECVECLLIQLLY